MGILFFCGCTLHAASLLETLDTEVAALYEQSKDAIVKVHAEYAPQAGGFPLRPVSRAGTGFFIDADGHLLTAATVIEAADSCWIEWRSHRVPAKIIGRDAATNLAVLQVPAETNRPFLKFGNSDELRVGSVAVAIGFPYDLPSAPAVGFVSGFDIQHGSRCFATTHFRAGCRLSPGEGGGPLLNAHGEVIGIAVAARFDDQCYALPSNAARKILGDLVQFGCPQHGWVGLAVTERRSAGAAEPQVIVQQVFSNTAAAATGFRDQDVLETIGTNRVRCAADVLNTMFYCRQGQRLSFTVRRTDGLHHLSLLVGERPPDDPPPLLPPCLPPAQPANLNALPLAPAAGAR